MPTQPSASAHSVIDVEAREFLFRLIDTPAPSGFEGPAGAVWREHGASFAQVREDAVGNSYATVNAGSAPRIVIAGHLDEIGLIVTKVDDKGYVRATNIGGWDVAVLIGQRVRILAADGIVYGTIGRPGVHQMDQDARNKLPQLKDLWIDIGADDGDAARQLVSVGDPMVLDVVPRMLNEHRIVSRSLDNRLGSFIALEAARELVGAPVEVTALGTTHEETGGAGALTAAYAVRPDAAIAIDITTASDTPAGLDAGDFSLGKGPIITRGATTNVGVVDQLIAAADANDIPYQLRGMGIRTRTDADAIAKAGPGVPTGLLSIPARYLHSPCEQADLRDVRATVDLLVAWARSLG